ncbi:IMP dehydrogenase [bacterium]|nr:IMP dehydrogenase [bacterium]
MEKIIREGLTFDDVLLVPAKSNVLPKEVSTETNLTKKIRLYIPILSSPMDTVTEHEMAIALAREGGIGIIHKNMKLESQLEQVDLVKRSESGMIQDPITLSSDKTVREALALMGKYKISGIPIVDGGKLVGILTNRDLRFETDLTLPVSALMTSERLVTVPIGTTLKEAEKILQKNRIEKLLVVKGEKLVGLITVKDIQKKKMFPNACKDEHGRLRVGAAVGVTKDVLERVSELAKIGVDVITIDTAHGHSSGVLETVKLVKSKFPELQAIAGNVATEEATRDLIRCGADAVKVGIGPGSICTTRIVTGVGVPQITAILDCAKAAKDAKTPIIADGGIRFTGDVAKAIAAGASSVMMGSMFAGLDESPGEIIIYEGRTFKQYRGMGSLGAMQEGSKDRYFQDSESEAKKLVPEGIEGRVPYKGKASDTIYQFIGSLRSSMGYCGTATIEEMQTKTEFIKITNSGLFESHPHNVQITKESPNYRI